MRREYFTLVAALPELPPLAHCEQLPISRIALDRRLGMLEEADRVQLARIEVLYFAAEQGVVVEPDANTVRHWQRELDAIDSPLLRERLRFRLEWQTLLAALRYRAEGRLEAQYFHGVGRWTQHIRRHWHEPTFGLEQALPALAPLFSLMQKGDAAGLELQLGQLLWRDLLFQERASGFAFEAVACFVLRFGLVERRIAADGRRAQQRFRALSDALLDNPQVQAAMRPVLEDTAG